MSGVRIAFATCRAFEDGFPDDRDAAALAQAQFCVWDDPLVDWEAFDRVVIRSTWDSTFKLDAFLAWIDRLGSARLRNRPDLLAFNADKRYLSQFDVATVPTEFVAAGDPVPALVGEVVVKPTVSAGARDTGRFPVSEHDAALGLIDAICQSGRTAMVQPYLSGVTEQGETSVVYIGNAVSHILRKREVLRGPGIAPLGPGVGAAAAVMAEDDLVIASTASQAELRLAAAVHQQIIDSFGTPLYARVDMVPGPDNEPMLLELEALDPCLYLATSPGAAQRLALAIA